MNDKNCMATKQHKIQLVWKLHSVCRILHYVYNYTLCVELHIVCKLHTVCKITLCLCNCTLCVWYYTLCVIQHTVFKITQESLSHSIILFLHWRKVASATDIRNDNVCISVKMQIRTVYFFSRSNFKVSGPEQFVWTHKLFDVFTPASMSHFLRM